jgi:short-subunit dehydrogenase
MLPMESLTGRVIVITGASSGFGELIAQRCVAAGARVALAARTAAKLDQLAASLGGPARAIAVATDVGNPDDVARLAQTTLDHFGHVDVLVNNAGFGVFDRLAEARLDDIRAMMEVNVFGALACTQAFLPHMRARRSGQIVMMASMAGLVAAPNMGGYTASKHALVGLSRTLMLELEGSGVRCAMICPGVAETGFQHRAGADKYPRIARLSVCTAEQVADATVRAIARRTHGEIVVPWYGRLLALISYPLPGATRAVMRLIG